MKDELEITDSALPNAPEPYWRASKTLASHPTLNESIEADVAIVGGGITGITAAYLLSKAGKRVALLEADSLANGTTGHTTAKITAQHGAIYYELMKHVGKDMAKLYYEAADEALQFIRQTVQDEKIDCDFSNEDAYLYTTTNRGVNKLENEYEAYVQLGINGEQLKSVPINVETKAALKMNNQAQFHPLKYLSHLLDKTKEYGGLIFEHTVATDIVEGETPVIKTRNGYDVKANSVIIASHFPFYDPRLYFAKMYAERSYVVAMKVSDVPSGMYLSVDNPSRSLRYTMIDGEKLAIIGGEEHKTGQGMDTMYHYEALEQFAMDLFGTNDIDYRWSAQDLITLDKIPYIGRVSRKHPNVYVATGYRKWGMTNGTAAARLIADLILNKVNKFEDLYTPSRFVADPSIRHFISQNTDVAKHLLHGKFDTNTKKPEEVEKGEASIVSVNNKRAGAYRDDEGNLHVVDTTCTHMGCEVHWNHGERSWDCPCHGSRFSYDGDILEGPAKKPLMKLEP